MIALHPSIADLHTPEQIKHLPRNSKGFPVPWFVAFIDGEADFRVVKPFAVEEASKYGLCWVCGHQLTQTATYVAGPMCGINRTTAEPPSHTTCARYVARACPFLSRPHAVRRENTAREALGLTVPGTMIERNPGVVMLWHTVSMTMPWNPRPGETLFRLPDALAVDWVCEGREATRLEVEHSVQTGIPLLKAEADKEGPDAQAALFEMVKSFAYRLPRPAAPDETATEVTGNA